MRRAAKKLGSSLQALSKQKDHGAIWSLRRGFAAEADLKKTPLYDFHLENGAKMVPFTGWSMPLLYKDTIINSTLNCRQNAALFDVSHMCGLTLKGADAVPFIETLVVGDIQSLKDGTGTLSVFTNEKGGSIDDSVITKVKADNIYLVVNAGCRDKDLAHIGKHLESFKASGKDVTMHVHDERSLLALQGPISPSVLQKLTEEDLSALYFSEFKQFKINGFDCFVTRTGYTGEDGFEISVPNEHAVSLAKAILDGGKDQVLLAGLGARDSLRLEAGLCLYGNDMDETISPIEAGLTWTVGKRRRATGGFLGADIILKQIKEGVSKKRVGLISQGAPARAHSVIYNKSDEEIGHVTSGAFSPCLKKNIAMGYVATGNHKEGTPLVVSVRDKKNDAVVVKTPFVPHKYYKRS